MTKKDKLQNQNDKKSELFKKIKEKFTEKPILKIYQLELLTKVEIDTLDFILKTCLLQKYSKIWHLIAYYSYKITPLKLNYNIYNKELLGIVVTLKK